MKINATVNGWVNVRKADVGESRLEQLRKTLTITPYSFGREEPEEPVLGYRESTKMIRLPIAWAMSNMELRIADDTSMGSSSFRYNKLPDPNHESAAEGQAEFIRDLLKRCRTEFVTLGNAPTGSGKTVSSLYVAAKLGRKTLVIVPTTALGRQWKLEAKKHLGLSDKDIGWVQQDKCSYKGKSIVIAVINSLVCRRYSDEFYDAFGTVIWDEVHVVAARSFSQSLGLFSARYKIAMTATPTRKDGCAPLFLNYFGSRFVQATGDAVPCDCFIVKYERNEPLKPISNKSILLNIISKDSDRNEFIVRWVKSLWRKDRNILVVSDRIEHLQKLMVMCRDAGIPSPECGLFTAQRIAGTTKKCKTPKKITVGKTYTLLTKKTGVRIEHGAVVRVIRSAGKGHYYVKDREGNIAEVASSNLKGLPVSVPKYVKVTEQEQDAVKANSKIIFATYGMFKQGQDVPRLDAGIDVTPRSDGIQVIGRIRRKLKNKPKPVWITIRDVGIKTLENSLKSRIRDFRKAKVEVYQYGERPIITKQAA